jgi:3-deoxy-manno-octulosonate cytidylyltransferase (CMP-KDO synthetase)
LSNIIGIIPARYASTRFPGKPLVDIKGQSMIQRVYNQAKKSLTLARVIVATDDERIFNHVTDFGGEVCMTSQNHPSGTDRCAEVVSRLNLACKAVINIQGDEPFIDPAQIDLVGKCFEDERTQLATLIKRVTSAEVLFNPNSPKVIVDSENFAIYFSRHAIPYLRGADQNDWLTRHSYYQHIGIYGYTVAALSEITRLQPSLLEKAESLEQLRWLEHGYSIKTALTTLETVAIDTPSDLENILKKLSA